MLVALLCSKEVIRAMQVEGRYISSYVRLFIFSSEEVSFDNMWEVANQAGAVGVFTPDGYQIMCDEGRSFDSTKACLPEYVEGIAGDVVWQVYPWKATLTFDERYLVGGKAGHPEFKSLDPVDLGRFIPCRASIGTSLVVVDKSELQPKRKRLRGGNRKDGKRNVVLPTARNRGKEGVDPLSGSGSERGVEYLLSGASGRGQYRPV